MKRVGFTGSRHGMTPAQMAVLGSELGELRSALEFHYGDCVGADEEALHLAARCGGIYHAHPATLNRIWDGKWRADTALRYPELSIIQHEAKHPVVRNQDIVNAVDLMFACPQEPSSVLRSGTWSTIRFVRAQRVPLVIIYPDGSTS